MRLVLPILLGALAGVLVAPGARAQAPEGAAPSGEEAPRATASSVSTTLESSALGSSALAEPPANAPPPADQVEEITREVAYRLRCPVCQGLSIEESHADGAVAMKTRTRELVSLGYSAEQVCAYFVDRYGDWILLDPPKKGVNWLVWAGPGVLVLLGGIVILGRARGNGATPPSVTPPVTETLRDRVLAELGEGPPPKTKIEAGGSR